jgi:hypothetical protein
MTDPRKLHARYEHQLAGSVRCTELLHSRPPALLCVFKNRPCPWPGVRCAHPSSEHRTKNSEHRRGFEHHPSRIMLSIQNHSYICARPRSARARSQFMRAFTPCPDSNPSDERKHRKNAVRTSRPRPGAKRKGCNPSKKTNPGCG